MDQDTVLVSVRKKTGGLCTEPHAKRRLLAKHWCNWYCNNPSTPQETVGGPFEIGRMCCMKRNQMWGADRPGMFYARNFDWDKYSFLELGKGKFGVVYAMTNNNDPSEVYAVKMTDIPNGILSATAILDTIIRNLDHANIVGCCKVSKVNYEDKIYFVMFMDKADMTLEQYINETMAMQTPTKQMHDDRIIIAFQVANAVAYIASKGIIHSDIKLDNFLLDGHQLPNGMVMPRVMMSDFGLSQMFAHTYLPRKSKYALWYRAPEVICGEWRATVAADVWACGCVLYEILALKRPFGEPDDEEEALKNMVQQLGMPTGKKGSFVLYSDMWQKVSAGTLLNNIVVNNTFSKDLADFPGAESLLLAMLDIEPLNRPTPYDVINSPLFRAVELYGKDLTLPHTTAACLVEHLFPNATVSQMLTFDYGGRFQTVSSYRQLLTMEKHTREPILPPQENQGTFARLIQEIHTNGVLIATNQQNTALKDVGLTPVIYTAFDLAVSWYDIIGSIDANTNTTEIAIAFLDLATLLIYGYRLTAVIAKQNEELNKKLGEFFTAIVMDMDFDVHRAYVYPFLDLIAKHNGIINDDIASLYVAAIIASDIRLTNVMSCSSIAKMVIRLSNTTDLLVEPTMDRKIDIPPDKRSIFLESAKKYFSTIKLVDVMSNVKDDFITFWENV
jgi:serine/threonine protein kinase